MLNRRSILSVAMALPCSTLGTRSTAQVPRRIEFARIEAMFAQMRARAPWNVDGPLLWGYFFFDPSQEKLKRAAAELELSGYRVVGVSAVPRFNTSRLHVEKVEIHTPLSLHARNSEFYALAARLELASYDGMDVGPPPK